VLAPMVVAAAGSELAHNPVRLYLSSSGRALLTHARGTADRGEHRKAAGAFADIACRQLIQINAYCLNFVNRSYWKVLSIARLDQLHIDKQIIDRVESAVLLSFIRRIGF